MSFRINNSRWLDETPNKAQLETLTISTLIALCSRKKGFKLKPFLIDFLMKQKYIGL